MRSIAIPLLFGLVACDFTEDPSLEEIRQGSHGEALEACDGLSTGARLECLRDVDDALALDVFRETGSRVVALDPLDSHRELARTLCDPTTDPVACEAELERMLGGMMDVYLEGNLAPPPQADAFARCHEALHDAMLASANDLALTVAHLEFAQCVEASITAPLALVEAGPEVADDACVLLTARGGDHLTADRVLRCQADWQIAAFAIVHSLG